jgi:hypothetical protein
MHNAPRPGTANAGPKLNETGSPEAVFFSRIAEPDQLAPSWLPRQQRRHVDRQLRRLLRRDVCSICGNTFKHNSRTAVRAVVDLSADLLPVPDDEAVAHTMFEIAMQREADGETLRTLIKKYQANGTAS